MRKIVHYEIPVKKVGKAINFYEKLFGWRFEDVEGENYWFIETGNEEITAGLERVKPPNTAPLVYISIESIEGALKLTKKLGGKVLIPKAKFKDKGYYAVISDPSGNNIGLWEKVTPTIDAIRD